jgi:hypothetical protein
VHDSHSWSPQSGAVSLLSSLKFARLAAAVLVASSCGGGADKLTDPGPDSTYAVTVATTGDGTVTSTPAGISCPGTCTASFAKGTQLLLTATPSGSGTFDAWGGACAGTTRTCTVAVSAAASITAGFGAPPGADETGPWRRIFAGFAMTCGVTKTDVTYCWGSNERGQAGDGTQVQHNVPTKVNTTLRFTKMAGDRFTMCGVTDASEVYCWGGTSSGSAPIPRLVRAGLQARDVAVGDVGMCALQTDGVVSCWSLTGEAPATPTPVSATLRFGALYGVEGRFCAVTVSGDAYCWMSSDGAVVGAVTREPASQVLTSIATAGSLPPTGPNTLHACGLTADGTAYCWGINDYGQLGDGTQTARSASVRTSGATKFATIGARGGRTCGLGLDGRGYCWGLADVVGPGGINVTPKVIAPALRLAAVAVGTQHTCVLTPGGAAYCWGAGGSGQLGIGDTPQYTATPQRVLDPP